MEFCEHKIHQVFTQGKKGLIKLGRALITSLIPRSVLSHANSSLQLAPVHPTGYKRQRALPPKIFLNLRCFSGKKAITTQVKPNNNP
jgi:hypothetical protein